MIRIAIAGAPSSGKSSLCRSLVNRLATNGKYVVHHVTEYARDYINSCKMDGTYQQNLSDQMIFLDRQSELEMSVPGGDFMVTDGPVFMGLPHSLLKTSRKSIANCKRLAYLWDVYYNYESVFVKDPYDLVVFLPTKRVQKDGCRSSTDEDVQKLGESILGLSKFLGYNTIEIPEGWKIGETSRRIASSAKDLWKKGKILQPK